MRSRLPLPAIVLAVLGVAFLGLPFVGLVWRAPWGSLFDVLGRETVREALLLSLRTSLAATVVAIVLGLPVAWLLATVDFPGRSFVRALCTMSMVLPPVVGGVALFAAFGRRGVFGQWLDRWFDLRLPFTTWGVIVAQAFVSMPFLVITVEAALRQFDGRYEQAARTLGASPAYAFRRVTLPAIRPALVAGAVLAWARALGEFGATITFAGNFPGRTQTMPLATYLALDVDPPEALIMSLILVGVSVAVLVGLRDRWIGGIRA